MVIATPTFTSQPKRISILGSTGTIGQNTVRLIETLEQPFQVEVLTAKTNIDLLVEQAEKLNPSLVVIADENLYQPLKEALADTEIEVAAGKDAIDQAATRPVDIVVLGIVGAAALNPAVAAIRQGTVLALANKECLVCAGELMMKEVEMHGATLIPVDSEHNALFQVFDVDQSKAIEKLYLTASGGPFRTKRMSQLKHVTPDEAVQHPNWKMGAKISVDSATMVNKALEMIEAYYLFPVAAEQIDVLIHPESIVHGLISYNDGSVLAGMSTPDMCTPIAYALGWPERVFTARPRLDLLSLGKLTFEKADDKKFPALRIAQHVLDEMGNRPVVFNAANEVAVERFLKKELSFLAITKVIEEVLERMSYSQPTSLEEVKGIDYEARQKTLEVIGRMAEAA